ncbi:MAG TPA: cyclic nucleotide-binding domain-containing protein [Rhodocyclaceae bacterium]
MHTAAGFARQFPQIAADLGPDNLRVLLDMMSELDMPASRKIIRDRMPVDSLYFILDGRMAISIEEGGRQIPLGESGPGEWLGEVSVLSGEMLASSTVTTLTPVKLLRLKHQAFEDLLHQRPQVASVLLRQLTDMLADRLKTSLASGMAPIKAAALDQSSAPKGLLWSLIGGGGG